MNNEGQVGKKQKAETKKVCSLDGVIVSPSGEHKQPVFKRIHVDDVVEPVVQKVDEFDLFEFIQSSKSSTDLALLQKRFIELGEIPSVDPTLGSNDLTNMPANIHEVYSMAEDIASNFAKLPKSIQDIFGTKEVYMKSLLDGTYQATLLNAINVANQAKPQEKKPEESEGN